MNQNKRNFFKFFGAGAVGITLGAVTKPKELVAKIVTPASEKENSKLEIKIHPQSVKRTNKG